MISKIKNTITYLAGLPQERNIKLLTNYNINDKYKRIYFYHIRKSAGKSVTDIIMSLEGKDHYKRNADLYNNFNHRIIYNDKVIVGWHPILIQKGYYYYAYSHNPYDDLKIPPDTFTFTCLRDPITRLLSYYQMLQRLINSNNISKKLKKETQILGKSLSDFLENIPKEDLLNQLYMFSKNYSVEEAVERILGLSYFFFVENFEEGIRDLGNRLGLKLKVLHSDKTEYKNEIPNKILSRIKVLLQPEYELIDLLKNKKL